MEYRNLTPHTVTVYGDGDVPVLEVPASGTIARIAETARLIGRVDGITVDRMIVRLGDIAGLPERVSGGGITYIVSMPLAMALVASRDTRGDVAYPYGQVRDSAGRIIGCRSLGYLVGPDQVCDVYRCVCECMAFGYCSCHCICPCQCGCGCEEAEAWLAGQRKLASGA